MGDCVDRLLLQVAHWTNHLINVNLFISNYSMLLMVKKLCEYYEITEGEIEQACNGLSAFEKDNA